MVSDKQEIMAKFLRPKVTQNLPEYLSGFPNLTEHKFSGKLKLQKEIKNLDDAWKCYVPQWDVPEVKWGVGPGASAAFDMLLDFIKHKLKFYGVSSNDPSKDYTSKLSPWLNFGKSKT